MKDVKYTGPLNEVEVPALGLTVKKGESVEVTDAQAKALLRQETWQESKTNTNSEKEAN